jgi:hypothetical protein
MRNLVLVASLGITVTALSGCGKELVITQDQYINTARHKDLPPEDRTGEPLEVNVVYVYPQDLKHEANGRLSPDKSITSQEWFADRPKPGDTKDTPSRESRFWIPKEQILLLNNPPADSSYGIHVGNRPRGAAYDKSEEVLRRKLDFKGSMGSDRSVIYVFAKFIDAQGRIMPKPPAKFNPPGDYDKELRVRIRGEDLEAGGRK